MPRRHRAKNNYGRQQFMETPLGPRGRTVTAYERGTSGKAYVRYLPKGVPAGSPGATHLIVATYPFPNALPRLKAIAKGRAVTLPGGVFAYPDPAYPKSVHMAFPGSNYQVEVYDPSPAFSRKIALSGAVQLVQ